MPRKKQKFATSPKFWISLPALTPALLELGHWIAGYYLATRRRSFSRHAAAHYGAACQQQMFITDAGKRAIKDSAATLGRDFEAQEISLLSKLLLKEGTLPATSLEKLGVNATILQRLSRRGLIEIRQNLLARKQRTQTILAWRSAEAVGGLSRTHRIAEKSTARPLQGKALDKFGSNPNACKNCCRPNAGRSRCRCY